METYNKYTLIKWLKEAFIQAFQPVTEEKLQSIEKLFGNQDYDDLYRLANMVDRFGWDTIFEAFDLEVAKK